MPDGLLLLCYCRQFTDAALGLSLTVLNSLIDLVSFSGILYSIYPPLFAALLAYSIGGTLGSIALGKVCATDRLVLLSQAARSTVLIACIAQSMGVHMPCSVAADYYAQCLCHVSQCSTLHAEPVCMLWPVTLECVQQACMQHHVPRGYSIALSVSPAVLFLCLQSLVGLNFNQEAVEADLRYGLVRVRENAESIAFYGGQSNEMAALMQVKQAAQCGAGLLWPLLLSSGTASEFAIVHAC